MSKRRRNYPLSSDDEATLSSRQKQRVSRRLRERDMLTPPETDASSTNPTAADFEEDYKISVDWGTTFTTVAYVKRGVDIETCGISTLPSLTSFSMTTDPARQIPTESYYPPTILDSELQPEHESHGPNDQDTVPCPGYLHGWEVQETLGTEYTEEEEENHNISDGRLSRMKLLLDNTEFTREIRDTLETKIGGLKKRNIVRSSFDVITHYLTVLLCQLKEFLQTHEGFHDRSTAELIISVPVSWTPKANNTMCQCMIEAMRRSGVGLNEHNSVPKLFMVNESEAAATYALQRSIYTLRRSEVFVLVDAGGGTVDVGCYRVRDTEPLRLDKEINPTEGALCGSSNVNQRFLAMLLQDLREAGYFEDESKAELLRNRIDTITMPRFESSVKRMAEFSTERSYVCSVPGLKPNEKFARFKRENYVLSHNDMKRLFERSFIEIERLIRSQIGKSIVNIDKVLIVGGFSDSVALRGFLESLKDRINDERSGQGLSLIEFILPQYNNLTHGFECATGVAKGALLRALDKENGPSRTIACSFGFLRHIPHESKLYRLKDFREPIKQGIMSLHDGEEYLADTITWAIKVGDGPLAPIHRKTYIGEYIWRNKTEDWTKFEALYASQVCNKDHFQVDSLYNRGKVEKIGSIRLDLNWLKRKPQIRPRRIQIGNRTVKRIVLNVLVEFVLIDRNLTFNVRWLPHNGANVMEASETTTVSVVGAFEPGTN
ncbi:hypothetical protein BU24DRAFT_469468 [Aaosphaeria arxii CBS 175.79]|uniref:Actin-like ATPase domain-containing protein n=1 Tax=Aaosphaeria arxii CBS 175.79 TaxID=1450172 RepID=A0A6A5Y671_9PLEO|nr:uncharacterized protein BU24DRAFT_469468 [Aaosphaeria arxii CBS 175.79]KAF2020703.1 hypothetical protein BU24DRAFT_469468 [Aaosphaeria arxii CBS 175.79]